MTFYSLSFIYEDFYCLHFIFLYDHFYFSIIFLHSILYVRFNIAEIVMDPPCQEELLY